jgi:hypothetical protein
MATTPVKPPPPPPPAKVNPPADVRAPKPNPLHGPTPQDVRAKQLAQEQAERDREEGEKRAEMETQATQERLEKETAGIANPTYLSEQAKQEQARIAMREEAQAAAHRAPVTKEEVPVVGAPPPENMAEDPDIPDEATLPPSTREEMKAGREGLQSYEARAKAEHEAGQKAVREHANRHPDEPNTLSPPASHSVPPTKPGRSEE